MQTQSHGRRAISTLLAVTWLGACAGNGQGLDQNGRPIGSGGPDAGPLTADFDSIQSHVFTPVCTACHAGGGAPQGLRLDATSSYDLLVGVPSNEQPSTLRVKPGDPNDSYLIQKLEGHAAVGARMPLGGPYLDQATIDVIRQWITDGAQRPPGNTAVSKPFMLATTAPANGDRLPTPPSTLVVAFTHELDRSRIDSLTARLERLGVDSTTTTPQPVPTQTLASDANHYALIVQPGAPLAPGRYALHIDETNIADLSAQALTAAAPADAHEPLVITFEVAVQP
jgi:hypothetical protein